MYKLLYFILIVSPALSFGQNLKLIWVNRYLAARL